MGEVVSCCPGQMVYPYGTTNIPSSTALWLLQFQSFKYFSNPATASDTSPSSFLCAKILGAPS